MANVSKSSRPIGALTLAVAAAADGAIQIFPAGDFSIPHGAMMGSGPWRLDEAAAQALIATVAARANPLVIDYEHQTLLAADNGQPAPAAGWIAPTSLEWRADGLYAVNVQWTEKAAAMIAADEYKFLSPVFTYEPKTGNPTDLLNVALTNHPAIDGMSAVTLAAASSLLSESTMDDLIERICYMLNIPLTSTPEEINGHLDKLKAMITAEASAEAGAASINLVDLLTIKNAQIASLRVATPDPAKYVPIEAHQAQALELSALRDQLNLKEVADLIDPALSDGRLLPAQEAWARSLGEKDIGALKVFLDTAQPIAALRGTQTKGNAPESSTGALTNEQVASRARAYFNAQGQAGNPITYAMAVDAVHAGTDR